MMIQWNLVMENINRLSSDHDTAKIIDASNSYINFSVGIPLL